MLFSQKMYSNLNLDNICLLLTNTDVNSTGSRGYTSMAMQSPFLSVTESEVQLKRGWAMCYYVHK
jgi:hypothetical protein